MSLKNLFHKENEENVSAACGTGDKKPSACGSACGAGDSK